MSEKLKGKVKWFNSKKGYGFITGDDSADYFVHYSNIIMQGHKTLNEAQRVTFESREATKGKEAFNVVPE